MTLKSKEVFHENMRIWPQKLSEMLFWRLLAKMWTFGGSLGSSPSPYVIAKVHWEKKFPSKKLWILAYILMLRAQNAAPRQRWTPPMTITPQVAPMANQAFETSQFIFFWNTPFVAMPSRNRKLSYRCMDGWMSWWMNGQNFTTVIYRT